MNAKGLLIKLAGIMLIGIIVVSCTPKKSAEQSADAAAMEARIAELQAQLLELTADDEAADESTRRQRRQRAAEIEAELSAELSAQSELAAAGQTGRSGRNRQTANAPITPPPSEDAPFDEKADWLEAYMKQFAGRAAEENELLTMVDIVNQLGYAVYVTTEVPPENRRADAVILNAEQIARFNIIDREYSRIYDAYRTAQPQTPQVATPEPYTPPSTGTGTGTGTTTARPQTGTLNVRPASYYFPGVPESQIRTVRITNDYDWDNFMVASFKGVDSRGLLRGPLPEQEHKRIEQQYIYLIVDGNITNPVSNHFWNWGYALPDMPEGCTFVVGGRGYLPWGIHVRNNSTLIIDGDITISTVSGETNSRIELRNGTIANPAILDGAYYSDYVQSIILNGASCELNDSFNGKILGAVYIDNGGRFTMSGGDLNFYVYINDGGTFIMRGGTISDYNPKVGGAYFYSVVTINTGGSFVMSGGTIRGNSNPGHILDYGDGGAVAVRGGSFTMSGGTISGNRTSSASSSDPTYGDVFWGGGGVVVEGGSFTMSGGTISGNTAGKGGGLLIGGSIRGGLDNFVPLEINISGGTISGNTAVDGNTNGHNVYLEIRPTRLSFNRYYRDTAISASDRLVYSSASPNLPTAAGQTLNGWTKKEDLTLIDTR